MSYRHLLGSLLLVLMAPIPAPRAQEVIAQMQCIGSYGPVRYQGPVLADLWQYAGASALGSAGEREQLNLYLRRGEMDRIPGTLRLFAGLRDSYGNLVNFEVFLTQTVQGTGSLWVNGARHRETYLTLILRAGGFTVYLETGGQADFACD